MIDTTPKELSNAIHSLGDGNHSLRDIENEIVKLRHLEKTLKKKGKKKNGKNK